MSNVATILARKGTSPVSVDAALSVLEALRIMEERNIGSVVVKNGEDYLGIFTERDYSRKVILKGKHSVDTKVGEVMSENLPAVQPLDTLDHCMELMSANNVKYLPVYENGEMSGLISISDVIREQVIQQKEVINHLKSYIHG